MPDDTVRPVPHWSRHLEISLPCRLARSAPFCPCGRTPALAPSKAASEWRTRRRARDGEWLFGPASSCGERSRLPGGRRPSARPAGADTRADPGSGHLPTDGAGIAVQQLRNLALRFSTGQQHLNPASFAIR